MYICILGGGDKATLAFFVRNLTTKFRRDNTLRMIKIEGETRIIYTECPLRCSSEPEIGGRIEQFLLEKLYPMPENSKNPLCWKVRCDTVFADFWRYSGPGYTDKKRVEEVFWATAKLLIPTLAAHKRTFNETLMKERVFANKKEQYLYHWKEVTYELDAVGYNNNPPNPWTSTKT